MAKIEFPGIEQYMRTLAQFKEEAYGICKYAVYDGAAIVADAIKESIPRDSGDLAKSMILTEMMDDMGYIYTQIAFPGYDRRGVPNPLKATVLEHGSSTRQKHPFIRPAVNRVKNRAVTAMEKALDKKISELMKE